MVFIPFGTEFMKKLVRSLSATLMLATSLFTSAQEAPAPSVIVQTVAMQDVTPSFELVGRVEAQHKVDIRARVSGFLIKRDFKEGTSVSAGQVLFEIEAQEYLIEVEQANADLASAKASLSKANADFKRQKNLKKRGVASQADYDTGQAQQLVAQANVLKAQAQLKKKELDLSYTKIYSPIDGKVAREKYSVGNLLTPNSDVLTTVTSMDPIYVTLSISEKSMLAARRKGIDLKNPPVAPTLKLSDGSIYPHQGHFNYVDTAVNTSTDTILVRAQFSNANNVLLPGELVQVVVTEKQTVMRIVVKQSAVQKDKQGYFVLVVDSDNNVSVRRITVGQQIDGQWEVHSGLVANEKVIIEGLQKVRAGSSVNPVEG
jgi:membrane fusion protein (multidrug efflux system)